MSNKNQSQIDDAYRHIDRANGEIAEHEYEIRVREEKINRLKEVKRTIATVKQEAAMQKASLSFSHSNVGSWKGTKKDEFESVVDSGLISGYSTYYGDVDTTLDEINNEITRLENEKNDWGGGIGWLLSEINSLFNWIENLMN